MQKMKSAFVQVREGWKADFCEHDKCLIVFDQNQTVGIAIDKKGLKTFIKFLQHCKLIPTKEV